MLPFVPKGYTGQLLVVGETPQKDEDARGLLRQLLRDAGVRDVGVSFVPTVRCQPPKNGTPTMKQIRCCRPFLLTVIDTLAPRAILGMGGSALRAFTNDGGQANATNARGRPIPVSRLPGGGASDGPEDSSRAPLGRVSGSDSPVSGWISYHSAAALYPGGTHLPVYISEDIRRAVREVVPPEPPGGRGPSGKQGGTSNLIAIDTEWAPDKTLLTVGVSDGQSAKAVGT